MSRGAMRVLASLFAIGTGLVFVFCMPNDVWKVGGPGGGIPVPYLGYFFAAVGVLGLCGVNVFLGGPLDKRHDANFTSDDPE
jgi:hypothetical protein